MSRTGLINGEVQDEKADVSEPQSLRSKLTDGGCILMNIASTVILVFLNKWYVFGMWRTPAVSTRCGSVMAGGQCVNGFIGFSRTPN